MKKIQLTLGQVALVDDGDYESMSRHKWCAHKIKGKFYAVRNATQVNGVRPPQILMHREIMGISSGLDVDHADGNGLNCQRYNLREATRTQNLGNQGMRSDNSSGFKGVNWHKASRKWLAQIRIDKKVRYLGLHGTPEAAADAYREAAESYHGEFARTS